VPLGGEKPLPRGDVWVRGHARNIAGMGARTGPYGAEIPVGPSTKYATPTTSSITSAMSV
jgi:hypothetical protein